MCLIIYKVIICLLSIYICLPSSFFPFNSQVFYVSNCILLNNYVVFMKKIFKSHSLIHEDFLLCSYIQGYKNTTRHKNMAYMTI